MADATINAEIHKAYHQLKTQLTQRKGRITTEESPTHISVVQGSLWGTSAKTAQKTITYTLQESPQGTTITSDPSLTKAYLNFTLVGKRFFRSFYWRFASGLPQICKLECRDYGAGKLKWLRRP